MKSLEEIKKNKYLEIKKEGRDGFGGTFYDKKSRCHLNFIMSWGAEFEHCSVSMPTRCPSWEQMCSMKDLFWKDDEVCMQLHPAKKDYVNNHPYCLHIWRPINKEIPTPPSILVGLKKDYTNEEVFEIINAIKNNELPKWGN